MGTALSLAALAVAAVNTPSFASAGFQRHLPHATVAEYRAPAGKFPRITPAGQRHEEARPASVVRITVHRKLLRGSARRKAVPATTPVPPFTECPPVGEDTSCGILIQVTNTSNNIIGDPSQGPYDGSDDTLIGLLNSSSDTISSVQLSSDTDLFGFDGDGLCTELPAPAGCPFGPTGYEGAGTSFTDITPDQTGGVVNFSPGIAPGQSAYFSLEEPLTATTISAGGPSVGEQGGPVNLSENRTTCSVAEPVNCATGTFWRQFAGFSVPGLGLPLAFSRTYSSSQASVNGPLGFGWTDSYDMSLATDSSGDVTVSQEDGSTVTFVSNSAGGFTAAPRVLATLTENPDGSYTFIRNHSQDQYNFSATGQLTSEVDPNGYTTQLGYNTSGQLTTVSDPSGRTLTFSWNGAHIATVTDPIGRVWSYSYDSDGNLSGATDPLGRTWSFIYDSSHQMLMITDPRGGVTTNVYNGSGQVTSQTDPNGGVTTWSYTGDPTSASGGTTTMTDPDGNTTIYQYANLELMSVTHAAGTPIAATTSYTYDPATLGVTSVADPGGNITTSSYDSSGNLVSTTDPLGNTTSYSYSNLNELLSKTDPLDNTTSYNYDGSGNLLSVTDPLGNTTSYSYGNPAHPGEVRSTTDPDGRAVSYVYDPDGDVTSVSVSPSSGVTDTTKYTYDADGERVCMAFANATAAGVACPAAGQPTVTGTTATSYNADGETTSVTDPDGHKTSYAYDQDGNRNQATDPAGHVTTYAYNGDNQQTKITRPDGTALISTYDPAGNLTGQTNGAGATVKYTYDALSQVTSSTNPLNQTTSYGYDAAGDRTTLTDPSGRITTYSYDADRRLTGLTYSDGKTPDVSYGYNAGGQRASMTDGTGTTDYSYDADGHISSLTNGAGATVIYGYDSAGHLTSLTYPNGNTVNRTWNGAGWLSSVSDWLGHTTKFSYDHDGNLTGENYPNGVSANSAFDNADELTSITDRKGSTTLASFGYTRDSLGQVTTDTETGHGSQTNSYGYNQLSQLTSDNSTTLGYDAAGNPTSLNGTTQSFNANSELTSAQKSSTPVAPKVDVVASGSEVSHASSVTSLPITTGDANELVLAFVSAAGPSGGAQKISKVSGGGLTWSLAARSDGEPGTAEVWQAHAISPLTNAAITATFTDTGRDAAITVATYTNARAVTGAHATASGNSTSPAVTVTTTGPDSWVWGAGEDATNATKHTPVTGETLENQTLDTGAKRTFWAQRTSTISTTGTKVKFGDTTSSKDAWNLAAVEITSASGLKTTYGYDSDGNRTSTTPSTGPATSLTYDQANRLTSYGGIATYAYNGDGLRMSKTVNGTSTTFAWDQSSTLPLVITAGTANYIYGPGNQPIEQISGSTVTYLQADQQGSTRLLTNSAGTVAGTYTYNSYGVPIGHTGTDATALGYDGQYTDTESGLQYLQARYYNPGSTQFISVDPEVSLTLAPYSYAADNAVTDQDPTGLVWYNPFSWSPQTWHTIGTVTAVTGAAASLAAVCVATACAADVAVFAGATTLDETLGFAETAGEIIDGAQTATDTVGYIVSAHDIYDNCPGQWTSAGCLTALGGIALDGILDAGGSFIDENSVWNSIYHLGSAGASSLYEYLTDQDTGELRC